MRYIAVLAAVAAVCCAGCMNQGRYWGLGFTGTYQRTDPAKADWEQGGMSPLPAEEGPLAGPGEEARPGPVEEGPVGPPAPVEEPGPVIVREGPPGDRDAGRIILERTAMRTPIEELPTPRAKQILPPRRAIGISLGNVYGNRGEAIDGERYTDFENGTMAGLNFCYMPSMKNTPRSPYFDLRYGVEVRLETHAIMLNDDGLDLGVLSTDSGVVALKFVAEPIEGNVIGLHADAGMGWGLTYFTKDGMLKQDDYNNSRFTKIETGQAQIFAIGFGVDLVLAPDATLSLDYRYENVDVPVKWSENGAYRQDRNRLNAGSGRFILTFRYYF
jgi:hypothetical protein